MGVVGCEMEQGLEGHEVGKTAGGQNIDEECSKVESFDPIGKRMRGLEKERRET